MIPEGDFHAILAFIEERTGIALPESNFKAVNKYITEKISGFSCTINDYIKRMKTNELEYEEFINVVTINETYFFREEKQFRILDKYIFPKLTSEKKFPINIWSAACSTGEEAVSLLALANKHLFCSEPDSYAVYASDISSYVLSLFRQGEYSRNSFRRDGNSFHNLLDVIGYGDLNCWNLKPGFQKTINIRQLNLCEKGIMNFPRKFNIIFLRNTLIYMQIETRLMILDNLVNRLEDDGYLFLSMSETALLSHPELRITQFDNVYFFRKIKYTGGCGKQDSQTTDPAKPVSRFSSFNTRDQEGKLDVSPRTICRIANEPPGTYIEKDSRVADISTTILKIVSLLNSNKLPKAENLIEILERNIVPNEIVIYLKGYLKMISGKDSAAIDCFRKALILNSGFWLPRFHLGKLLREKKSGSARREIIICKNYLSSYINNESDDYQFMMEGFNAKYFETICEKWLEGFNTEE